MRHRYLVVAAVAIAAQACVGEHEAWVPHEIEIDETLERIGDTGYQMLCGAADGALHDAYRSQLIVKAACTAHALRVTDDATSCTTVANECLDKLPSPVEEDVQALLGQAGCDGVGVSETECKSPVFELIECLDDVRAALDHVASTVTCDVVHHESLPEDWWRISPPASCVNLVTGCAGRE